MCSCPTCISWIYLHKTQHTADNFIIDTCTYCTTKHWSVSHRTAVDQGHPFPHAEHLFLSSCGSCLSNDWPPVNCVMFSGGSLRPGERERDTVGFGGSKNKRKGAEFKWWFTYFHSSMDWGSLVPKSHLSQGKGFSDNWAGGDISSWGGHRGLEKVIQRLLGTGEQFLGCAESALLIFNDCWLHTWMI